MSFHKLIIHIATLRKHSMTQNSKNILLRKMIISVTQSNGLRVVMRLVRTMQENLKKYLVAELEITINERKCLNEPIREKY